MATIAFTGLTETTFRNLLNQQQQDLYAFVEVAEEHAREEMSSLAASADVYLIGEKTLNPIRLAQTIQGLDAALSVLIINDAFTTAKIKKALLFTPYIGNTVQCLSNEENESVLVATWQAIERCRQRRTYTRLKVAPIHLEKPAGFKKVQQEYLDKFLEEAPIGAVLMSEHGVILDVNKQAAILLNVPEKQLLGISFQALFTAGGEEELQQLLQSDAEPTSECTLDRMVGGKKQFLNIRLSKIATNESVPYRLGIINDLTETYAAKQRVEEQVEELQSINEQLKRANADLDAFVYTASHDLKAPIANIEGLIELLKGKVNLEDPELFTLFAMVDVSIERFQNTIKDLTEVALIQKRSQDEPELVDALEIIEEVQLMLREMIISANAHILVDCPAQLSLRFPRSSFRSIVFNLLSNALKYRSPRRTPSIHIRLKPVSGYTLLTVQDNGLGIPAQQQDKLFSMFKRFHTHVEGTGIGLFIVKRIIDTTGSTIEVASTEGEGTLFQVHLRDQLPI